MPNTLTIGKPLRSNANQCAACAAFRDRYREAVIPIRFNDTGETIILGATCLKRIMAKFYADNHIDHARVLTGSIYKLRSTLIIDLAKNYPRSGLNNPMQELAFLKRDDAQADLYMSADDMRLYLKWDIEHRKAQETTSPRTRQNRQIILSH